MTPNRPLLWLAAAGALGAAGTTAMDLLDGADQRWAVAANLLLVLPAAALAAAAWQPGTAAAGARHAASGRVAALCALGVPVGLLGAVLRDRAGVTWWWLALETAWLVGVALAAWPARPGLSVVTVATAVCAAAATVLTGLPVPQPVTAGAGLRVALTVAWAGWVAVDLAVRPAIRSG